MVQVGGGVGISTWLSIGNDTTLGLIFNAAPAALMPGDIGEESQPTQVKVAADLRAELTIADITYYAVASVSGSAETLPELNYWSASVNLGIAAKMPRLLAE
jgi:hypothetical protein